MFDPFNGYKGMNRQNAKALVACAKNFVLNIFMKNLSREYDELIRNCPNMKNEIDRSQIQVICDMTIPDVFVSQYESGKFCFRIRIPELGSLSRIQGMNLSEAIRKWKWGQL